jgi:outer membrane protein TolC
MNLSKPASGGARFSVLRRHSCRRLVSSTQSCAQPPSASAVKTPARVLLILLLITTLCTAQNQPILIERPTLPIPFRSYVPQYAPPIRLSNSQRLHSLIRGGNLYLSVRDALALAIENNLNLEIDRYGPLLAGSSLERARAGGPIRGVPSASQQVSSVNSGVGVNGAAASAGVSTGGGGGGGGGGNGGVAIQQVGAVTRVLDPSMQSTTTFSHLTQPQANTVLSQTDSLVQSIHSYNNVVQQGLLSGGVIQFRSYEQYLKENAPDLLNPALGPHMDLLIRHDLLQNFGVSLNNRDIRIAQMNVGGAREVFRSQLFDLTVNVLNLYWDLVSAREQLKVRQRAVEITQKFVTDTRFEISIGAVPAFEISRAEAEQASRRQDLTIAQVNLRQSSNLLKEALSHTADPQLEAAEIIPLDSMEVPETEELAPVRDLLKSALGKRPDVAVSRLRDQTSEIALAGTTNPLLPSLQVTAQTYNRGLSGQSPGGSANSFFVGGYGSALSQIFRRNFPNNTASISFQTPFHNRQAQGDYGIDQLQFRQNQLRAQKDDNQILVDISSQLNALRQARSRYATARSTRVLQEQLLEAEQKRAAGVTALSVIMGDQRALIAAQLSEMNALASYTRARISLDQVLGETLERNGITLEEGLNGKVDRESTLPDILQQQAAPPEKNK